MKIAMLGLFNMIKHVLKDGRQVESVAGIVIKQEDFNHVYQVIERIEKRCSKEDCKEQRA